MAKTNIYKKYMAPLKIIIPKCGFVTMLLLKCSAVIQGEIQAKINKDKYFFFIEVLKMLRKWKLEEPGLSAVK